MADKIFYNSPLPHKVLVQPDWVKRQAHYNIAWELRLRVIFFNPIDIYNRIGEKLDPFRRHNYRCGMEEFFPPNGTVYCDCGCGRYKKKRLATEECGIFAYRVRYIICGGDVSSWIETYYGNVCVDCNAETGCDMDHIIPVKHGGGACWLSNYVPRCHKCHVNKTNKDFKRGDFSEDNTKQIEIHLQP